MFCPKCGNQNPDDARFCGACNAALTASSAPRKKKTPFWLTAIICAVVFAASSFLARSLFAAPEPTSAAPQQDPIVNAPAAPAVQEPVQASTYTVHAMVPDSWTDVRIWAWSDLEGNAFEAWPGETMTQAGDGWYTYDVPLWVEKVIINGNGGFDQTADIPVDQMEAWLVVNEDLTHSLSYVQPDYAAPVMKDTISVYVLAPQNWSDVRIWAWSDSEGDAFDAWPGEAMISMNDGWYIYDVPNWCTHVIISNGGANQTDDIPIAGDTEVFLELGVSAENPEYLQFFMDRGLTDVCPVSDHLDNLSGVMEMEDGSVMKMEFGSQNDVLVEAAYTCYYNTSIYTADQKVLFANGIQETFQPMSNIPGASADYQDLGSYYRVTIHYTGIDDPAMLQQLIQVGLFPPNAKVPITASSTRQDMEAEGYIFKY